MLPYKIHIYIIVLMHVCCINSLTYYSKYVIIVHASLFFPRYKFPLRGSINTYFQSRFQTFARRKRSSVKKKKGETEVIENTLFARIYFNTRVRSTSDAQRRDALTSAV